MLRRLARALPCAGLALALLAAGPASAQPKTEVRVAMLAPSSLLWLHAIAQDQGFYAERGLDVKPLVAGGSPALLQAVSSGSVEAGIAVADLAIRAIDKGAPVVIAGAVLGRSILRLVGGTGVDSVKDMAGKPLTAGGVEGGTANLLRYLVGRGGADPRGVRLVAMANSKDRIVAMKNGQVSGALLIAPFDTMAQQDGMKVLDDYEEAYLQTPLVLNKTWAAANPKVAADLTQATRRAAQWINDPANKQKAIDILAAYTKTDPAICAESYAFIVERQKAIPADLAVTAASLENLVKIDKAVGASPMSERDFDLTRYYDPSFLAAK